MSNEKANRLIKQLAIADDSCVVDIGCGEGEFLIQITERYKISGVGLDSNPECIELANEKARLRVRDENLSFVCQDPRLFNWEARKVDLIICIGSEFILGGYRQTLQNCYDALSDAGRLLVGTVFWKKEPTAQYLELMAGENPHVDYLTTVDIAIEEGFIPLYLCRSSEDEWDDFEGRHAYKRYVAAMQSDDQIAFKRIHDWQRGYLKWGRTTMGFGFFLLQKHAQKRNRF